MKKKYLVDFNLEEFEELETEREQKRTEEIKQRPGKLFFWCCWVIALIICIFALSWIF